MENIWELAEHFDPVKVEKKLQGNNHHYYEQPKVTKACLKDALIRISHAVEVLFSRTHQNYQSLGDLTIGTEKDRGVVARLEKKISDLETKLQEANEKIEEQRRELSSDIQSNSLQIENSIARIDQIQETEEEHHNNIRILQRTAEKQHQVINRNKLDVKKVLEYLDDDPEFEEFEEGGNTSINGEGNGSGGGGGGGGGKSKSIDGKAQKGEGGDTNRRRGKRKKRGLVDSSAIKLTADQIFCNHLGFSDNAEGNDGGVKSGELISLSHILEQLHGNHNKLESTVEVHSDRNATVEEGILALASKESLALVDEKVETVCSNLDHLLQSFHTAGILESAPPPMRTDCDKYERSEDEIATDLLYDSDHEAKKIEVPQIDTVKTDSEGLNSKIILEKLNHIRSEYKSTPVGKYKVTKAVKDLEERFGSEVDAVVEDMMTIKTEINYINKELELKMEAAGVDNKIEIKFDEVVAQLETAIQNAGADEKEFKQAAKELQDTCSQLMATKANQSELLEVKRKMEIDSKLSEQVKRLQQYTDQKLDIKDAKQMLASRVAKEELGRKLTILHQKLVDEMEDTINVKQGIKPFAVGNQCNMGASNHSSPLNALTCLACNRRVTKGQMEILHGRGKCEKRTHLTHGGGFNVKLPSMNRTSPRTRVPRDGQKVIVFDSDNPDMSQWSQGMLEPLQSNQRKNQEALSGRPQTVASANESDCGRVPQTLWRAQTATEKTRLSSKGGKKIQLNNKMTRKGPEALPLPHEVSSRSKYSIKYEDSTTINNSFISEAREWPNSPEAPWQTIPGPDGNPILTQVPLKEVKPTF